MKIGVYQFTSPRYSGGRVYLWQYCWAAAMLGHDVTLVTNRTPLWKDDLPAVPGPGVLRVLEGSTDERFDILVTDTKCTHGKLCFAQKQRHPSTPLFVVNFETSNWVKQFDPGYAAQDSTDLQIARRADHVISISELAKQHFILWAGYDAQNVHVVHPVINDHALRRSTYTVLPSARRYAVWSGHATGYKGWATALRAVYSVPCAFDLVVFGEAGHGIRNTPLHRVINYTGHGDAEKFHVFRGAHVCLAPSLFEGYGMVPGEALACGTQCVAYDLPVLREAYKQPLGLHYCEWNNSAEFIEMTRQVASSMRPDMPEQHILKGRSLADMITRVKGLPYHGS